MAWTDETKAKAVELYAEGNPTPANSTELCAQIAEELGESPNGVRMILMKAGVYVKKDTAPAAKAEGGEKKEGSKRVSKEDSINALKAAITAAGKEVDEEVVSKLTGKAAVYFTSLLS